MFKWTNATDLNLWAERRDSQDRLPELLRKLAYATLQDPQRISFPSGESVQFGGWDGIVETLEGNLFIPSGNSGWELGTNRRITEKANEDYEKRSADPNGLNPVETTFIFVTPRRWIEKERWVEKRNNENKWLEVRAYDANDLEQWLEQAPAVGAWFARVIGKYPSGAQALSDFWSEWQGFTRPVIPVDLLLETRENEASQLREWLSKPASILSLVAETREEAAAFLAAVAARSSEDVQNKIFSRALIIEDENSWRYLAATREHLILIPYFDIASVNFVATEAHHILIPQTARPTNNENLLVLGPIFPEQFQKALVSAGIDEEKAHRITLEAGRRLSVLRRSLAVVPEAAKPAWAKPAEAPLLTTFLLVGGWLETNEADRNVLEVIANRPYRDLEMILARWVNEADAPIRKIGDRWELVSHEDAWRLLQGFLSNNELVAFFKQVELVLVQINPRFDLPPVERYLANIKGKIPSHSEALREGLATTLGLMGSRGERVASYGNRLPQDLVDDCVFRIFKHSTEPHFWPSISEILPILAEAAPDRLLEYTERDLAIEPSPIMEMFVEEGMFGTSPHTGLLWALETYAWEPRYLTRVTLILGKLARLDPGGRSGNRPSNSLQEIFISWRPQTSATLEQRIEAIDELARREPDVAWALLYFLLPSMHGFSMNTRRPRWRNWGTGWTEGASQRERVQTHQEAADRILNLVDANTQRWMQVLTKLEMLSSEHRAIAISKLEAALESGFSSDQLLNLWNGLRLLLHKHNQFSDARWALPSETVGELGRIYERITPKDVCNRFCWLFSTNPQLPDTKTKDWKEEHQRIQQEQHAAAGEIIRRPLPEILDLIHQVERPGILGYAIGNNDISEEFEVDLMAKTLPTDQTPLQGFLIGFVAGRYSFVGEEWVARYLPNGVGNQWSPASKATFARGLPLTSKTWDLIASCGDDAKTAYWRSVQVGYLQDGAEAERAVKSLLEIERPYEALDVASFYLRNEKWEIDRLLLASILREAAKYDPSAEGRRPDYTMLGYHVGETLSVLERSGVISDDELGQLEWIYLPLLQHGDRGPHVLYRRLEKDPHFFVELLCLIYRSEEERGVDRVISEEEKIRATLAFELLHSWNRVPGIQEDGQFDPKAFESWVSEARRLLGEVHRTTVGDINIGEVLAYAPTGSDGIWPDVAIRNVIEEAASERLDNGFCTGVFNKRGVYSKAIRSGGKQERELAEYFRRQGDQLTGTWPQTASLLYRIAHDYEALALREDISAEER